jgi:hypothetical protein
MRSIRQREGFEMKWELVLKNLIIIGLNQFHLALQRLVHARVFNGDG